MSAISHAFHTVISLPVPLITLVGLIVVFGFGAGKLVSRAKLPMLIGYMLVGCLSSRSLCL